jgi:predicted ATPase
MELLEREADLQELARAWRDVAAGEGRVALVSGEAGIGKTTLVERFTRQHRDFGRVLWGACDALFTPRPLGPLHDMAAQTQSDWPALLAADTNRTAIFSAVLAELQSRPTIAVFEDVHWADEATLDLLKYLSRRVTRTPALLVLTYRDDELDPKHPLRTLLGDMATSPAIRRIPLSSLSEKAVRALVGQRAIDAPTLTAKPAVTLLCHRGRPVPKALPPPFATRFWPVLPACSVSASGVASRRRHQAACGAVGAGRSHGRRSKYR